jgi:hypothetical protein
MSTAATAWAWRRRGLTPIERLVLLTLADAASSEGECRVPFSDLREMTELNDCDLTNALAELKRRGLITPGAAVDLPVCRIGAMGDGASR